MTRIRARVRSATTTHVCSILLRSLFADTINGNQPDDDAISVVRVPCRDTGEPANTLVPPTRLVRYHSKEHIAESISWPGAIRRLLRNSFSSSVGNTCFFVATATADSRINLSPKGLDSLRVMDANRVVWLNLTGSGNETAAHVRNTPRMTLMFCSFDGEPLIVRLYGTATVIHRHDPDWAHCIGWFDGLSGDLLLGARQIFDMRIDLVQTSCGFGVPLGEGMKPRHDLEDWTRAKGAAGIAQYWRDKNARTIDDAETGIVDRDA